MKKIVGVSILSLLFFSVSIPASSADNSPTSDRPPILLESSKSH